MIPYEQLELDLWPESKPTEGVPSLQPLYDRVMREGYGGPDWPGLIGNIHIDTAFKRKDGTR